MSKRRGPYKKYLADPSLAIPRQTRYNWRQGEQLSGDSSPTHHDGGGGAGDSAVNLEPGCSGATPDPQASAHDEAEIDDDDDGDMDVDYDHASFDGMEEEISMSPTEGQASPGAGSLLYEGAQISEKTGVELLLSLTNKHKLSLSALGDILKLVALHLPSSLPTPSAYRSVYMLLKHISETTSHLSKSTITHR